MKRRFPVHTPPPRPRAGAKPPPDAISSAQIVQSDTPADTSGGLTALMERAMQEILAVSYWFDPVPYPRPYSVTVRFTGHRVGVKGRFQSGDRFIHDETIAAVVPGSGPIAVTAKVHGVTPGEWIVTATPLGPVAQPPSRRREHGSAIPAPAVRSVAAPLGPLVRLWRHWAPSTELAQPVHTSLAPFIRVPGILPGVWGVLVTLGIAVALVTQSLVLAHGRFRVGPAWVVFLVAIAVGIVGARVWYSVLHRHDHQQEHSWEAGWCIQGFIVGASVAAALALALLRVPAGVFLDTVAPGLMFGMAVGRVGCFFAGCCGGPPTVSRWGVWSSDQHVGARRVPTQLLESALAFSLGLGVLVAAVGHGPAGGAFFIGVLAAYTLVRQGILRLRAERRRTRLGGLVTAAAATVVLVAAIVVIAVGIAR
jgi:phosphatidylglycerol:prolipoprotein diacylglycerol transferase